jgi:repressor LexA
MSSTKLSQKEIQALKAIRNLIVHKGSPPSVREIMSALDYKSPHSAMLIVNDLIEANFLFRDKDNKLRLSKESEELNTHARTINIPLVGTAPCGTPLLAEENIEMMIPVSVSLAKPPYRYFFLRTVGDSMNEKGIQEGDLVLVRQQNAADNGDTVVALIDEEATIKEYHRTKEAVILKPRSSNKQNMPIVLTENFLIQGVVVATIPPV